MSLIKSAELFLRVTKDMNTRPGNYDQDTNEFNTKILDKADLIITFAKMFDKVLTSDNATDIIRNFSNFNYCGIGGEASRQNLINILEYFCEQHYNYDEMFEKSEEPKQQVTRSMECTVYQTFDLTTGKPESQNIEPKKFDSWSIQPLDDVDYFMDITLDPINLLTDTEGNVLERIMIPKAQMAIVKKALALYQNSLKNLQERKTLEQEFEEYDCYSLMAFCDLPVSILISQIDRENFTAATGVDFPEYVSDKS